MSSLLWVPTNLLLSPLTGIYFNFFKNFLLLKYALFIIRFCGLRFIFSLFYIINEYTHYFHSMEECDALSSRIGIMSQGELVCLGTSQHLKSRFASGYSLQLKTQDYNLEKVKAHIARTFPLAHIADEHGGILYNII